MENKLPPVVDVKPVKSCKTLKEAVTKFSSPLSGKNLPFSTLSDKLNEKVSKKKK